MRPEFRQARPPRQSTHGNARPMTHAFNATNAALPRMATGAPVGGGPVHSEVPIGRRSAREGQPIDGNPFLTPMRWVCGLAASPWVLVDRFLTAGLQAAHTGAGAPVHARSHCQLVDRSRTKARRIARSAKADTALRARAGVIANTSIDVDADIDVRERGYAEAEAARAG